MVPHEVYIIGCILGDYVPEEDEHWLLVITLLQIMNIVFSPVLSISDTILLRLKIKAHHELFLKLFPNRWLTPKMHLMVHYPRLIRTIGPLILHWTMRFEGKHQFFKQLSHSTRCFKNISKSFAKRHQLLLCHSLVSGNMDPRKDEVMKVVRGDYVTVNSVEEKYLVDLQSVLACKEKKVLQTRMVEWRGVKYKVGMVVLINCRNGEPVFGKITAVIHFRDMAYLVCASMDTVGFSEHYNGYVIRTVDVENHVVRLNELLYYHPLHVSFSRCVSPMSLIFMKHKICPQL